MYRCWVNFFTPLHFQRIARRSVSSTPCVWWSSWKPAAPAIRSTAMASTSPCAAKTATPTPTTVFATRQSVWARPSSPSSIQGHVVSGAGGWDGSWLRWGFERANVLSNQSLSSSFPSLLIFIAYSICFTSAFPELTMCMSPLDWNKSEMVWWCSVKGRLKQTGLVWLLFKNRAFTSPLVHLPSIHPLIPVTLHPATSNTRTQNEAPRSCFIHPLCILLLHLSSTSVAFVFFSPLLCLCVFVLCVAISCIKKLFFLVSVHQSVCLSIFVLVAVSLAVWLQVESGVTQWATSSGGYWGVKPIPLLRVDLTGGVLYCWLFPLCPSVSLCH